MKRRGWTASWRYSLALAVAAFHVQNYILRRLKLLHHNAYALRFGTGAAGWRLRSLGGEYRFGAFPELRQSLCPNFNTVKSGCGRAVSRFASSQVACVLCQCCDRFNTLRRATALIGAVLSRFRWAHPQFVVDATLVNRKTKMESLNLRIRRACTSPEQNQIPRNALAS